MGRCYKASSVKQEAFEKKVYFLLLLRGITHMLSFDKIDFFSIHMHSDDVTDSIALPYLEQALLHASIVEVFREQLDLHKTATIVMQIIRIDFTTTPIASLVSLSFSSCIY
jgi:hypothetical protein